jgi:transposase, IS5 family
VQGLGRGNRFRVWISGQVRRTTAAIKLEMKRRAAIEPIIGHLKAERRMGRNYLKGPHGDRANTVLAAAGFNFHLLLRWLADLLRSLFQILSSSPEMSRSPQINAQPGSSRTTIEVLVSAAIED